MKARKVGGLAPEMPLHEAAGKIVRVRLDELCELAASALEPEAVQALHDCRIAAKRLRYVLEITGPILGPYAETALKHCKDIQEVLGDIHDCDVMLPWLDGLHAWVRHADAAMLAQLSHGSPPAHVTAYRGLERVAVETLARRRELFSQWLDLWTDLEREGFRAQLVNTL